MLYFLDELEKIRTSSIICAGEGREIRFVAALGAAELIHEGWDRAEALERFMLNPEHDDLVDAILFVVQLEGFRDYLADTRASWEAAAVEAGFYEIQWTDASIAFFLWAVLRALGLSATSVIKRLECVIPQIVRMGADGDLAPDQFPASKIRPFDVTSNLRFGGGS